MSDDLLSMLLSLDDSEQTRNTYVRSPIKYPGSKERSLKHILPYLPVRSKYIEPMGGSGSVLLARPKSKNEIYNDRYSGVVAFFRVVRDPEKFPKLCERLRLTVHSREEFIWCRDTWEHDVKDDVERAARWYYMIHHSFSGIGRQFARALGESAQFGNTYQRKLASIFEPLHFRLKNVQIENLDYRILLKDCKNDEDTVWYFDPPYLDTYSVYDHNWKKSDHIELVERIFKDINGYVAVSGYDFPDHPYNKYQWDEKVSWEVQSTVKAMAQTESNYLKDKDLGNREKVKETLWIRR